MVNSSTPAVINVTINESGKQIVREIYRVAVPMMLCACLLSIVLNTLILVSAIWVKRTLSPTLYFSLSLALADAYGSLVIGIGLVVNSLLPIVYESTMGPYHMCYALVLEAFRMSGLIASVLHLLALAINHYIGILRPLHYAAIVTRRMAVTTIIFMWLLPIFFFFLYYSSVPGEGFQSSRCQQFQFMLHSSYRVTVSLTFFVPLILMTLMYIRIFSAIRQHQRGLVSYPSTRQLRKNVKAVITTLVILGTYLVGWMPAVVFFVLTCYDCLVPLDTVPMDVRITVSIANNTLIVTKFLLNPVIYAARMPEIKDAFRNMLTKGCSAVYHRRNSTLISRTDTITSSLRLISLRRDCSRANAVNGVTTYVDRGGTMRLKPPSPNHYLL